MGEKRGRGLRCVPLEGNPGKVVCETEDTHEKLICELTETDKEVKLACKKPEKTVV